MSPLDRDWETSYMCPDLRGVYILYVIICLFTFLRVNYDGQKSELISWNQHELSTMQLLREACVHCCRPLKRRHKCRQGLSKGIAIGIFKEYSFNGLSCKSSLPIAIIYFGFFKFLSTLALLSFFLILLFWESSTLGMLSSAMAPTDFPLVEKLPSNVTSSNLRRELLASKSYYIRAPHHFERIILFSSPSPISLEDAQYGKKLVFFLKQFEYGLFFPFHAFFVEVFRFYRVSPMMLTPNSMILFNRAFEAVC